MRIRYTVKAEKISSILNKKKSRKINSTYVQFGIFLARHVGYNDERE